MAHDESPKQQSGLVGRTGSPSAPRMLLLLLLDSGASLVTSDNGAYYAPLTLGRKRLESEHPKQQRPIKSAQYGQSYFSVCTRRLHHAHAF